MVRSIAFLMRASKGAFSHNEIMELTWRQFETYLDAFRYLLRAETEDGQKENEMDDLVFLNGDEKIKADRKTELEEIKRKLEPHKLRMEKGVRGKEQKLLN